MFDPLDFEKTPLLSRLSRKRAVAALVLWVERAGTALWRLASWIAFFAGLWLLQIPTMLGSAGPLAVFALFLAGLIYLLSRDLRRLRPPRQSEIDRRLELDSGLKHRPLGTIHDKLVNPRLEPTRKLWKKNQEDAFTTIRMLRMPRLRPLLAQSDPWALRTLALLLLIVGIVAAGPQWHERLTMGLTPFSLPGREQQASPVTLWVTPPKYTGLQRVTLEGGGRRDEPLNIPEGSILKLRISDGFSEPVLHMGERELPLERLSDKSWGIETEVTEGARLVVKQWPFTRADIAYTYIVDTPPQLTLNGDTETLAKGEMRIPLKALDDYGVTDLTMTMDLDPMIEDRPMGTPYTETRAVMSPPGVEMEFNPTWDLSWHPWSGMPIVIGLEAVDFKEQKTSLPPVFITLPERTFSHPVARQLSEMRKRLIWTPSESAPEVSNELETVMSNPASYANDKVVFLAMRAASSRLYYDKTPQSVARVVELLWDTALRVEEGHLPLAARALQEAQRNLEQLLNNPDATDEDIAEAMAELREAMAEYFQELARELEKRMAQNGNENRIPPELFQNAIRPEDLGSFLDQLQSEALSGDRKSAREMLSQLQQFMDQLDPSMDMAMPPQMEFMMEGINEMQELIEKQEELRDQTQQQMDRLSQAPQQKYSDTVPFDENMQKLLKDWGMEDNLPPPPQQDRQPEQQEKPAYNTQQSKVEQDALRYILGQLMMEADEQLGEIPENLQKAEQEMRNSADRLGENEPVPSIPHQEKTIEHLQQGMQDMAQQMAQMMKSMGMFALGGNMRLDPLGRPMQEGDQPGMFPGSRVKIPDEAERKRVQEILKILRQRSGEVQRPEYELEYYRRLMKQF